MVALSFPFWGAEGEARAKSLLGLSLFSCQSRHEPDELREAKLEKNSSTLFTTEKRSTRRCTENPDASVKSPCPPCPVVKQDILPLPGQDPLNDVFD